jgi:hypothetical protein
MRGLTLAASGAALALFATNAAAMELTSPDIREGAPIAKEFVYTRCGGGNASPALSWSGAPARTKSFAVTAIDIDVPPHKWSHWIVVGVPPSTTSLGKGARRPSGAQGLMTDFGDAAYGGPCPPPGSGVHHYVFTVWALPTATIQFPHGATADDIDKDLTKDSLAHASITGTYER